MSNNAMSNETDLDWLARNVHVWPENTPHVVLAGDVLFERGAVFCESHVMVNAGTTWQPPLIVYRQQWLSRRAELQNKPSWRSVGSDINFISQHEDGQWIGHGEKPEEGDECFECDCEISYYGYGEILGDWRDTLEKRPEEFDPFVSIEDKQEQGMAQQQEMKQDSGWCERGELPPIGVVCEAYIDYPPQWVEAEIVAHKDGFAIGWCKSVMKGCHGDKASEFRPIRTERDELIEIIKKTDDTDDKIADAILAAGFSLGAK